MRFRGPVSVIVLLTNIVLFSAATSGAQVPGPFGPTIQHDLIAPPLPAIHALTVDPVTPFGTVNLFGGPVDPEVSLRQEILRVLIQNEPDRAIDIASDRLKADPSDPVVINNLSNIANSKSTKALPLILSIVKSPANTPARRNAINALGRISGVGLTTLEDLYKSSSDSVETRQAIVSAIAKTSEPRTVTVLSNIGQNDPDLSVRRTAIQSLSRHNDPAATKALEDMLKTLSKPRG